MFIVFPNMFNLLRSETNFRIYTKVLIVDLLRWISVFYYSLSIFHNWKLGHNCNWPAWLCDVCLCQKLIDTKSIRQYPKNQNYQYPKKNNRPKKHYPISLKKPKDKSNISQLLFFQNPWNKPKPILENPGVRSPMKHEWIKNQTPYNLSPRESEGIFFKYAYAWLLLF